MNPVLHIELFVSTLLFIGNGLITDIIGFAFVVFGDSIVSKRKTVALICISLREITTE